MQVHEKQANTYAQRRQLPDCHSIISDEWKGQDGRKWRNVEYHVGGGQYRRFLQVYDNGEWRGY